VIPKPSIAVAGEGGEKEGRKKWAGGRRREGKGGKKRGSCAPSKVGAYGPHVLQQTVSFNHQIPATFSIVQYFSSSTIGVQYVTMQESGARDMKLLRLSICRLGIVSYQ